MSNCTECGAELTNHNWGTHSQKKHYYKCNDCKKSYDKQYYSEHKEKIKQRTRSWQKQNLEKMRETQRRYYKNNREKIRKYIRDRRAKFRRMVLLHYSHEMMKCAKCGFDDERALSIDHINGGGTQHRKQVKSGGNFNEMLVREGYPEGYQILCMNCQFIKNRETGAYQSRRGMN